MLSFKLSNFKLKKRKRKEKGKKKKYTPEGKKKKIKQYFYKNPPHLNSLITPDQLPAKLLKKKKKLF